MAGFNIDPQISLGVKPPAQISIGDMVNIARGAQAYKQAEEINPLAIKKAQQETESGAIDLQVKQQTNEERLALQDFFKNPDNYQTDGEFDLGKVNASVPKIAPLTGPKYIETMTGLNKAQTEANSATQEFGQKTRGLVAGSIGTLGYAGVNDPKVYISELQRLKKGSPHDKALARYADAQIDFINQLPKNANLAQGAIIHSQELLGSESQYNKFAPQAGTVDTGQSVYQTVTQPSVGGASPTVETMKTPIINKQLPVGTEGVAQPGDNTGLEPGTHYKIGSSGSAIPQQGQPQPNKPNVLPSSTSPNFQANQDIAKADFADVQTRAGKAQTNIGILQEIKRLAPIAATGAAADRREMAIKWGQVLGLNIDPATVTVASASDLLKKESNMLAQAGGNTDASRVLAEMANPNSKMTKEAIEKASSQIIAQNKLVLLEQGVKQHFTNDPEKYIKAKTQLDAIKDPRALEYIDMSANERKNVIASLNTGPDGKALPKDEHNLSAPARQFLQKVDAMKKLNDRYNLGLF